MNFSRDMTKHAAQRASQRLIPEGVIDIILDFGESLRARDDARKYALSTASMRSIRSMFGRELSKAFQRYQTAYVVVVDEKIVTVAYARSPLIH